MRSLFGQIRTSDLVYKEARIVLQAVAAVDEGRLPRMVAVVAEYVLEQRRHPPMPQRQTLGEV